jgi:hypothetical protein
MLAQGITNPAIGTLGNPGSTGGIFLSKGIPAAVGLAFVVGALIFFFMLVWGAIQWITSGGDKQALESARGRITSALVGLVLLFAALAIIKFIESFFAIDILMLDIGPLKI